MHTNDAGNSKEEILARLEVIERMMAEGRSVTARYGGIFLLWGVAFLVAIGWALWLPHKGLAWVVTMPAAALLSNLAGIRHRGCGPQTPAVRAVCAVWIAVSAALFLYMFSAGYSGHANMHTLLAAMETLLGVANCASAIILRWRVQMAVAIVWFVSAAVSCFAPSAALLPILAVATLIGQIGFGLYLAYLEGRNRKPAVLHG